MKRSKNPVESFGFTMTLLSVLGWVLSCNPRKTESPRVGSSSFSGFPTPKASTKRLGAAQEPPDWRLAAEPHRPLAVIHKTPTKAGYGTSAVTITFNQPMVRLGRAKSKKEDPARFPVVIEPSVDAVYRWVAGDTLKVAMKKPLRNATRYRVTVPGSARSFNGTALKKPYSWTFETPRPEVLRYELLPRNVVRGLNLLPGDRFLLTYNLRMEPGEVERRLSLVVNGQSVGAKVSRYGKDQKKVVVRPDGPFPLGSKVRLSVGPGVASLEGKLPSVRLFARSFKLYGPLKVKVLCNDEPVRSGGRCWPMWSSRYKGLRLEFSEPVRKDEVHRHVKITPSPRNLKKNLEASSDWCDSPSKRPCSHDYQLHENLVPDSGYRVQVGKELKDVFGQRLGRMATARFRTKSFPAGIFVPRDKEGFREKWHPFRFKTVNVRRADVKLFAHTGPDLVRFVECVRKNESGWGEKCLGSSATTTRAFVFPLRRNVVQTRSLSLPGGLLAVRITSPQVKDSEGEKVVFDTLVQQTDLGLHARMSPFGLHVWVTSLRDARPLKKVEIAVHDRSGKKLWSGSTSSGGFAEVPAGKLGDLLGSEKVPRLYVLVKKGDDRAYLTMQVPDGYGYRCRGQSEDVYRLPWFEGSMNAFMDEESEEDEKEKRLAPVSLHDFSAWEGERPMLAGYISTERGIYRPGQRVYVHGAARVYRAWKGAPAAGVRAEIKLLGPEGVMLASRKVRLSPMGVFKLDFSLPGTGRLGYHRVVLRLEKKQIASHHFRVAEYRAPRFKLRLDVTPAEAYTDGRIEAALAARYLFGGPLDGASYRLSVTRYASYLYATGHTDFRVGRLSWNMQLPEKIWHRAEGTLDSKGRARLSVSLKSQGGHFPWPAFQTVEAEVTSADYRSVSVRRGMTQHPGEVYAAIKTLPGARSTLRRSVLVVSPRRRGTWPVRPGFTVTARLFGMKDYRLDWKQQLKKISFVVPGSGHELKIDWPGSYRGDSAILVLSVVDPAGREAMTAETVYRPTKYLNEYEKSEEDENERGRLLTIKLDKEEYLPGETASVTVIRKGSAKEAVLFLERERIFQTHRLRFDVRGKAFLRVKVEDRFARAITLRAVAVRGGKATRSRFGPLDTATKELSVSDKPYRLRVRLETDRKKYRPGDKVKVKLRVEDGLKRPRRAQVVLMAVDEAILRLTAYHLPDPLYSLLRTPSNGVLADDLRHHLAPLEIPVVHVDYLEPSMMGLGIGGGGGGGGVGKGKLGARSSAKKDQKPGRKKFLTCPWHATLVTDREGRAETAFTLPDNLTEYRIMAFAVDDRRSAGTGYTGIEVDLPLLALPALPRFVRQGDRFQGAVILYNTGLPDGRATVTARVAGDAVRADGVASKGVVLRKGKDRAVRFGFSAVKAGTVTFHFEVRMGSTTDRLEQRLSVQRPTFPEAASVSGETRGAVRQGIEPLSGLRPDHGGLEVTLSSTALVGVEDGMEQLIRYPYGCLEQKASRLLPMLAAVALGKRFGLKLPGRPDKLIRIGLADILAMQRGDGGFGYWPRSRMSWPWATAYALIVMHRVMTAGKAAGVSLPIDSVGRAMRFLRPFASNPSILGFYWFSYHAFILYALSLHGEDVSRHAMYAFERRRGSPLFARAMLLSAMALGRKSARIGSAVDALVTELSDSLRIDGTWAHAEENLHDGYKVMMHSEDRTSAMVLHALLMARPEHPMITRLVRWFLLGRKQARFRNTQEAAWALMALWDFALIREKVVPDFEAGVWLGQKRIVKSFFRGRSLKPSMTKLEMASLMRAAGLAARDLVIAKRGRGTLYYVARLRYARLRLPEKPRDHGMHVTKTVQVLDKAGRPSRKKRPPRLGDTVMVTLKVESSEARRYVVVDDPLPAGMEALDATLHVGSRSFGALAAWRKSSWWDHRELRDDRVLFFRDLKQPGTLTYRYLARVTSSGSFLVPPTKAEEMYTPEVFGHTAAAWMTFK